jgi:hypothetical protein
MHHAIPLKANDDATVAGEVEAAAQAEAQGGDEEDAAEVEVATEPTAEDEAAGVGQDDVEVGEEEEEEEEGEEGEEGAGPASKAEGGANTPLLTPGAANGDSNMETMVPELDDMNASKLVTESLKEASMDAELVVNSGDAKDLGGADGDGALVEMEEVEIEEGEVEVDADAAGRVEALEALNRGAEVGGEDAAGGEEEEEEEVTDEVAEAEAKLAAEPEEVDDAADVGGATYRTSPDEDSPEALANALNVL